MRMSNQAKGELSGIEFNIEIIDKEGKKSSKHSLPETMKIRDLKSYLLTLTDSRNFTLDKFMDNDQTLAEYGSNTIIVDTERHKKFDLKITYNGEEKVLE